MILKSQLEFLLKKHDISIASLARRTKISQKTLFGWKNGVEPKSISQVKAVADAFEVTVDYLCFGIEEQKKDPYKVIDGLASMGNYELYLRKIK